MPKELTAEHAKALYEFATTCMKSNNYVHAARVLEKLAGIDDPFYSTFALVLLSQAYFTLGRRDLELRVFKRVAQLPDALKQLLNPGWVGLCYQRLGDLEAARKFNQDIIELAPNDPSAAAALAEISLLLNNLDDADHWAAKLRERAEPAYQILGRIVGAIVLALRNKHFESDKELIWVGQFIISSGTVPTGTWDYHDLQSALPKLGVKSQAATLILDLLTGTKALPQFIEAWKVAPASSG